VAWVIPETIIVILSMLEQQIVYACVNNRDGNTHDLSTQNNV